jgi:hypothetical protein
MRRPDRVRRGHPAVSANRRSMNGDRVTVEDVSVYLDVAVLFGEP